MSFLETLLIITQRALEVQHFQCGSFVQQVMMPREILTSFFSE